MILALPEQLIGSIRPYTIITAMTYSRKIIYLGGFACIVEFLDLVRAFHHQLNGLYCYLGY